MQHKRAIELLPDLDSGTLSSGDEGELSRHVEGCPECRAWLDTYELFSDALAGPQTDHPSSEQLARYVIERDLLTAPEMASIEQHLADCGACGEELALTGDALAYGRADAPIASIANLLSWKSLRLAAVPTPVRWAAAAGFILAVALAFALRAPSTDRELVGTKLAGVQVFEATSSISAEFVTVDNGGNVTFRAGESVVLSEGFSVGQDATFRVEIPAPVTSDSAPGAPSARGRNNKTS